ncbi:bidirectional sugar transporter SWEET15-like [Argentina anserina]|uniref:bidirectional sugar transporter SWEET15-like n=1 Tax=Argentina anserina TaxID=57926 RepID=UPI0021762861|nr:bidirectional sugar transporter SWEET15-like [Potentilla anserina]
MPFTLSGKITLSGVLWFAYGLLLKDCITLPNGLGFVLGLLQMLFYAIYRKRSQVVIVNQENKFPATENVTILLTLRTIETSEVHYSVDAKLCDSNDIDVKVGNPKKYGSQDGDGDDDKKFGGGGCGCFG